jgi:hypothetical protein
MSIIVDHIVYLSDSDPDYNPESTEFAPRRPKRRRLGMNSTFYHRVIVINCDYRTSY